MNEDKYQLKDNLELFLNSYKNKSLKNNKTKLIVVVAILFAANTLIEDLLFFPIFKKPEHKDFYNMFKNKAYKFFYWLKNNILRRNNKDIDINKELEHKPDKKENKIDFDLSCTGNLNSKIIHDSNFKENDGIKIRVYEETSNLGNNVSNLGEIAFKTFFSLKFYKFKTQNQINQENINKTNLIKQIEKDDLIINSSIKYNATNKNKFESYQDKLKRDKLIYKYASY